MTNITGLDFVERVVERREYALWRVLRSLLRLDNEFATYRCSLWASPYIRRGCRILLAYDLVHRRARPTYDLDLDLDLDHRGLPPAAPVLGALRRHGLSTPPAVYVDYVVTSKWHDIRDALGTTLALLRQEDASDPYPRQDSL